MLYCPSKDYAEKCNKYASELAHDIRNLIKNKLRDEFDAALIDYRAEVIINLADYLGLTDLAAEFQSDYQELIKKEE